VLRQRGILLAAMGVLCLVVLVFYGYTYIQDMRLLINPPEAGSDDPGIPQETAPGHEMVRREPPPATFLIFGIDAGEWVGDSYRPGKGRADTIILLQVNFAAKEASFLSIPRDTLVEIPGRQGTDKINHSYAYGGTELLKDTVEHFTGVEVDYHFRIDYVAFIKIVNALGGVEFDLDRPITARGRRLEPGLHVLDGDDAFAVISFRRERMGDIARVERQQRFFLSLYRTGSQQSELKFFPLAWTFLKHVRSNISLEEAATFAYYLRGMPEENIAREIVPGWFYERGGVSYWKPDLQETALIVQDFFFANQDEDGDVFTEMF
jgi:polyisoprenyl-teichoic acid--peptidoglycan teichoic acid transferase